MKNFFTILLALAIILSLCACGGGAGGSKDGLKVGFGREIILPDDPVHLQGGDSGARLSTGYLDQIAATCISMTYGDETVLVYTMDFCTITERLSGIQSAITEATGIPEDNIIFNGTHTHSSVNIGRNCPDSYYKKLTEAVTNAALTAIADQSAAEVYYGSTPTEGLCFVRHYLLNNGLTYGQGHRENEGTRVAHLYDANTTLQVIKFARAAEDKKDIVLMSMGSHPNMIGGTNISADWPGAARAYVEENSDSLCAVFQAASGDQEYISHVGLSPYDKDYRKYGAVAGEYCVNVLNNEMTKGDNSGIKLVAHRYTAPSMKEGTDDEELMAEAIAVNNAMSQYGSSHILTEQAVAAATRIGTVYEAQGLVQRSNHPDTYSMNLHALAVGGVSLIFAPYEMFGVTGKYICDNSPYDMTFIVTVSETPEGHMGYMPHLYGCEEGFYGYDVTKFARGTAEDLAETYLDILTNIKNAE